MYKNENVNIEIKKIRAIIDFSSFSKISSKDNYRHYFEERLILKGILTEIRSLVEKKLI